MPGGRKKLWRLFEEVEGDLDHFLAYWDEELPPSLPLGHGGHYLYVGSGPRSSCYSVYLHCGGLH